MNSTLIVTPESIYHSGAIINRDGETLADLRDRRGVMFAIPKVPDKTNPTQRTIKVTGTPDGLVSIGSDIRQLVDACISRHFYFDEPLVTPLSLKEKLGIKNPVPTTAREAYGLDIYQARHLCSIFSVVTFKDLWVHYRKLCDEPSPSGSVLENLTAFENKVVEAVVGSSFGSKMILFLLKHTVNEPVLEHGMLSRFKSADTGKTKKMRAKQKQKADSDSELDDDGGDSDDLFGAAEESSSEGDSDDEPVQAQVATNIYNASKRKEQKNDNPLGNVLGGLMSSMDDDASAMMSDGVVEGLRTPKISIKPKEKTSPLQPIENEATCVKKYKRACATLYLLPKNTIMHHLQNDTNADLTEYRLGSAGATALAEGLKHKTCQIEILSVSGCDIDDTGGAAIAETTTKTARLRQLDMSKNTLGHRTAVALSRGFRLRNGLSSLNMANTGIGNMFLPLFARAIKKSKSHLTYLNISKCKLNDKGCKALSIALGACKKIQNLNVSWNNIGARSMYRLGDSISNSESIQRLDLSFNSLNDEGGVVFGAFLACCKSLVHVDCAENRLGPNSAYAIADGIRYCRTMRTLDISNNPLGENGVLELLHARKYSKLYFLGLKGTDSTGGAQANQDMFLKPAAESYIYEMILSSPKNRAYAQLLRLRAAEGHGRWASAKLNRAVLVYRPRKNKKWNVPRDGILEIDYRAGRQKPVNLKHGEENYASIHFRLNLAIKDEYEIAKRLLNLAVIEVGENWKNETFQGEPFEFDEQIHTAAWLPHRGVLEFDYVSPSFSYKRAFKFNLNKKRERQEAMNLAHSVHRSKLWNQPRFRDQWVNVSIDGEAADLRTFETKIGKKIRRNRQLIGTHAMTHVEKQCNLPNSGTLKFDYVVKDPTYLYSKYFEFNLADTEHRQRAINLFHRANSLPGETWWGALIDGKIARLVNIEGKPYIPKQGHLQFDYLYYLPRAVVDRMYRQQYAIDLNDKRQYMLAETLYAQFLDHGRYDTILNMKHVNIGNSILNAGSCEPDEHLLTQSEKAEHGDEGGGYEIIDPEKARRSSWAVPKTGTLELETFYFRKRPLLTDREFKSFLQEVRCQNSEMLKLEMLHMSCQGKFYLNIAMIGKLAREFRSIQGQRDCVSVAIKNLSEIHCQDDLYNLLENSRADVDLWVSIVELGKLGKKDGKDSAIL